MSVGSIATIRIMGRYTYCDGRTVYCDSKHLATEIILREVKGNLRRCAHWDGTHIAMGEGSFATERI